MINVIDFAAMLAAGLLVSFTPCLFPVLPAYLTYVAKKRATSSKTVLAFALSLSCSLTAYAYIASKAGQVLITQLELSPSDTAVILATVFLAVAVAQLTPSKDLGFLFSKISPRVTRFDTLGAAILGAFFAMLAAPCAAGPVLALVAKAALDPYGSIVNAAAFSIGASLPFLLFGVTAQNVSQTVHKNLSRSWLVKRSGELTAFLFTLYGVINLWSVGNPEPYIIKLVAWLKELTTIIYAASLFVAGTLLTRVTALVGKRALTLSLLLTTTGGLAFARTVLTLTSYIQWLEKPLLTLGAYLVTTLAWAAASAVGGGRVTKWMALSLSFATFLEALSSPGLAAFNKLEYTYFITYASHTIALGILPIPLAVAIPTLDLRKYLTGYSR